MLLILLNFEIGESGSLGLPGYPFQRIEFYNIEVDPKLFGAPSLLLLEGSEVLVCFNLNFNLYPRWKNECEI